MITISTKSAPSAKIAFYLGQADECGKLAESATLQNVRDRSLRAEAAWRKMASDIDTTPEAPAVEAASAMVSQSTPSFASFA